MAMPPTKNAVHKSDTSKITHDCRAGGARTAVLFDEKLAFVVSFCKLACTTQAEAQRPVSPLLSFCGDTVPFLPLSFPHRELMAYGVFGVLTTVLNYVVYFVCLVTFDLDYITSNLIAWILAILFAFVTNKLYVFQSLTWDFSVACKECCAFFSARVFSVVVETALLWLFIEQFACDEKIIKIFTNIVVVVLNYVLSKKVIFKQS